MYHYYLFKGRWAYNWGAYKQQQFMVLDCTFTSDITSVSGNLDVQCISE